jgi:hypothetical protein
MDMIQLISNLGFPIAIATYLLISEAKAKAADKKNTEMLFARIEALEAFQKEVLSELVSANTAALIKTEQALNRRPCLASERLEFQTPKG